MQTVKLGAACAALWIGTSALQVQTQEVELVTRGEPMLRVPHVTRGDVRPDAERIADLQKALQELLAKQALEQKDEVAEEVELVHPVAPKPLSSEVKRGLEWLRANQHENGGWSQGEEAPSMRGGMQSVRNGRGDPVNVADTCIAALALLRSGSTPKSGPYANELLRATEFVCGSVEASDDTSIFVTDVRGTRVQGKIGTTVDTFLASMLLTEVQGDMPGDESSERVDQALRKVLNKIEINQAANGGFEGQGWAPVLSQGLAGKALNRASLRGFDISTTVLASNDAYFVGVSDVSAGGTAAPGSAGVQLYGGAAKLGAQQEAVNNGYRREGEIREQLKETEDAEVVAELKDELGRIEAGRKAQQTSQKAMVDRLDDKGFVAGFGNNGGEEFLSYMNISESLVVQADDAWRTWDERITKNVANVQNEDGSWTGHHCITGRTFCTATALLTLMADRTQVPAELLANR